MEKMIDKKSLQLLGRILTNSTYKKAFIIAIMDDEDYEELKNLYIKLEKKDKEIENNLYNIIYFSKEKERDNAIKAEEKVIKSFESLEKFNLLLNATLEGYIAPTSLRECENRVPVLQQERKAIIDEINRLYDNYEEKYKAKINSEEIRNILLTAFGKRKGDMEEDFLTWIIGLRK